MSKKVLSIVLALALALSCFAVSAFAIGEIAYEDEDSTYTQKWSLSEAQEAADGRWYVDVTLDTDYLVGAMQFAFDISSADIVIDDVVGGEILNEDFGADIAFDSTGKTNIVAIIPNPYEDATAALDFSGGAVVCTVYFSVADGASGTVQIKDDAKSATNPGGTLFAARMTDGVLASGTSVTGQITTIESDARNIGAVSLPAELVLTAAGTTNGVIIDKAHTLNGAYTGIVYGFPGNTFMNTSYITTNVEASDGGTLEFSRSIGKTGYGTGTVITVKNADGTVAATYVVVIFGDVDANGLINVNDIKATLAGYNNATLYGDYSAQRVAANAQNATVDRLMYMININDVKAVLAHYNGTKIDQAALAARMQKNTAYYA